MSPLKVVIMVLINYKIQYCTALSFYVVHARVDWSHAQSIIKAVLPKKVSGPRVIFVYDLISKLSTDFLCTRFHLQALNRVTAAIIIIIQSSSP